jgi:hypothetical protein
LTWSSFSQLISYVDRRSFFESWTLYSLRWAEVDAAFPTGYVRYLMFKGSTDDAAVDAHTVVSQTRNYSGVLVH